MVRVGVAGWTIPKRHADAFPVRGSHLERYAERFRCVEINSSFHRPHRASTYARWAASVPVDFRFSLKVPKDITHKRKLLDCGDALREFLEHSASLGSTLGVYVVQLAPSHAFDETAASKFFEEFRAAYGGGLACEPRHESWFSAQASSLLERLRVTRIGADPALVSGANASEPYGGFAYYRWHGSPHTYYSGYTDERLREFASALPEAQKGEAWCIFDNTAMDAATGDALRFMEGLASIPRPPGACAERSRSDTSR